MIFLDREKTKKRKASLRRQLLGSPRLILYYESNYNHDYLDAARAFVASFGAFHEATLLYFFSVQGDGWNESLLTDKRWARFRCWRKARGEMRRLNDAPGQQFAANEGDALTETIAFSLSLGWDAWLEGNRGRKLVAFSHDDRVEVHRGCKRILLERELLRLGSWQIAGAS